MGKKSKALHQDATTKLDSYLSTLKDLSRAQKILTEDVSDLIRSPEKRTSSRMDFLKEAVKRLERLAIDMSMQYRSLLESVVKFKDFLSAKEACYKKRRTTQRSMS